jgi:hypothetical protein
VDGCEFGDIYAGTPAVCEIALSNSGDTPIHIDNFQVVSGSGSAIPPDLIVAPHDTAHVRMEIDTSLTAGRASYIVVFSSDPKTERRSAKVNGYVLSTLDKPAPVVNLDVVDLSKEPAKRTLELGSHEVADFRIVRIVEAPDWLVVKIAKDGRTLEFSVNRDTAPLGLQEAYVRVELNTPRQKESMVKVKADIHGDIVPSSNPLNIGIVHVGGKGEAMVRINSISHRKVRLGEMKVEGFQGKAESLPCVPKAQDCAMIRVTVSNKQPPGSLKGTLWVNLPADKQRLPISTWGFLVPKDYEIPKIGTDTGQSPIAAETPDIAAALKAIAQPTAGLAPPPPGDGPLLKWSVANAGSVYGFQIFRSDSETGPFLLMNPKPVHAETENNNSQAFQWRDNTAHSGSTYYYSIGILRVNGKKEHLAGPHKVVAK